MLQEFEFRLIFLAEEKKDFLIQRIQERIPSEEVSTIDNSLKKFVLAMPDMIIQIRRWMKDQAFPSHIKKLSSFLHTYIYHSSDFIPAERLGLFGYLDDAYLTGRIFIQAMNFIDHNALHFLPNMKNLATDIPKWVQTTRRILPKETVKIDQMLKEFFESRTNSFDRLIAHQKLVWIFESMKKGDTYG
ncbi:MAG: hypothetical protein ACMUIP_05185 [bacterium]